MTIEGANACTAVPRRLVSSWASELTTANPCGAAGKHTGMKSLLAGNAQPACNTRPQPVAAQLRRVQPAGVSLLRPAQKLQLRRLQVQHQILPTAAQADPSTTPFKHLLPKLCTYR